MTPAAERYSRIQEVFEAAADLPVEQRAALLDARCNGDEAFRREVEALLAADAEADSLDEQPFAIPPDVFEDGTEEQIAGRHFGPYEVVREIGRGGLGSVYLAVRSDGEYRKEVALKLIRRGLDTDDILRRFRNERQILAQLDHPNIARLIDGGTTDNGLPYFVMEYVKGEPITDYAASRKLGTGERLELFRKVCAAVTYAHQNLVIHRDLKPSNILVTADGEPKLLDFGIAKLVAADDDILLTQTAPGLRAMTPEYASPEQVKGARITTASDVYSLGVLLYELLTGTKPYRLKTRSSGEISRAITDQEPTRPSVAVAASSNSTTDTPKRLSSDLDNIVLMAMRKEPARRYGSAAQFADDIRRYIDGRPVVAHKDTLRYRVGKFVGRNKVAVAAAAAVLITLLAGLAITMRQTQIAREQRDNARMAERSTERLNRFLEGLLRSANPDGMGRDVKVVQVLDAAAARLDRELGSEPRLQAQAHLTIARAYSQLRSAEPAERHVRAALQINQELFGNDHPATAAAMAFLGRAMVVFRRFNEAEPLLRQSLGVMRKHPPADANEIGGTLKDFGWLLIATGRGPEAAPLVEEALAISRRLNGEGSVQVAEAVNNMGLLHGALKQPAEAKQAYRAALDIYRQLSPTPLAFLNTIANLSDLLFREGNIAEVEALLQEADSFCRSSIGTENPTYGALLGRLGMVDFAKRDYAAAVSKLQRCLETVGLVYPKTEPEMVLAKAALGLALTRTGRAPEAEAYLREALVDGKAVPAAQLALIGTLEGALAECIAAQQKRGDT